jgi:hypothetical protein
MGSEDARLVRDYAAMPQSRPQVCGGAEHQCGSSWIGLAGALKSPEAQAEQLREAILARPSHREARTRGEQRADSEHHV